MRVVVVGATGNVGTSVLHALASAPRVSSIVGVARRRPAMSFPGTEWVTADIRSDDLVSIFRGADAVVHLAWLIQPSRDSAELRSVNVDGSERVFRAAGEAGVGALVYASSIGAYSPGPKDRRVKEDYPTGGIEPSFYSMHKAEVETLLDRFERDHPEVRSVRLRPGLIFKNEAASEIRRYFIGPFLPSPLVRPSLVPVVPDVEGLRFQAVHSLDVGEAYALAVTRDDARGAYNVAAEPVLDPPELARLLGARTVPVPAAAAALGRSRRLARASVAHARGLGRHGSERAAHGHLAHTRRARLGAAAQLGRRADGPACRAARQLGRRHAAARDRGRRARPVARAPDGRRRAQPVGDRSGKKEAGPKPRLHPRVLLAAVTRARHRGPHGRPACGSARRPCHRRSPR